MSAELGVFGIFLPPKMIWGFLPRLREDLAGDRIQADLAYPLSTFVAELQLEACDFDALLDAFSLLLHLRPLSADHDPEHAGELRDSGGSKRGVTIDICHLAVLNLRFVKTTEGNLIQVP